MKTRVRQRPNLTVEAGSLAVSSLDMAVVRNANNRLGDLMAAAIGMAALSPAQYLGLDDKPGKIAPGYRANIIHY